MTALVEYGLLLVGLAIGGTVGWLVAKQSLSGQLIRAEEQLRANEASAAGNEQRIRAEVENIAFKIGEENSARFIEMAQAKLSINNKRRPMNWNYVNWRLPTSSNPFKTKWPNSPP